MPQEISEIMTAIINDVLKITSCIKFLCITSAINLVYLTTFQGFLLLYHSEWRSGTMCPRQLQNYSTFLKQSAWRTEDSYTSFIYQLTIKLSMKHF